MVFSPPQERALQPSFQPGANLGGYTTLTEIAAGQLSTVHMARSEATDELVVIKRLRAACAGDPDLRAAMIDEGRVARKFDSPHLTRLVEMQTEPEPMLAFAYVDGLSLATLIDLARGQDISRYVVPILVDALTGLQTMHLLCNRTGDPTPVYHQAPCARHILVGTDGQARLIDLSHVTGPGLLWSARRNERLRPDEMAPEQVLAPTDIDARCDVFILGVTLWEALTGERLFLDATREETLQRMLRGAVPTPSQVSGQCPSFFDRICDRALQRAPWRRFESAADMADALVEVAVRHDQFAQREELAAWVQGLLRAQREKLAAQHEGESAVGEGSSPASADRRVATARVSHPPQLVHSLRVQTPSASDEDDASHTASGTRAAGPGRATLLGLRHADDTPVVTARHASTNHAGTKPAPQRDRSRSARAQGGRRFFTRWTAALALGTAGVVGAIALQQTAPDDEGSRDVAPPVLPELPPRAVDPLQVSPPLEPTRATREEEAHAVPTTPSEARTVPDAVPDPRPEGDTREPTASMHADAPSSPAPLVTTPLTTTPVVPAPLAAAPLAPNRAATPRAAAPSVAAPVAAPGASGAGEPSDSASAGAPALRAPRANAPEAKSARPAWMPAEGPTAPQPAARLRPPAAGSAPSGGAPATKSGPATSPSKETTAPSERAGAPAAAPSGAPAQPKPGEDLPDNPY